MTRKEAMRQTMQADTLRSLGFTRDEAEALRRISMTLHRWFELECGDGNGCIERDEKTGIPYWHRCDHSYVAANDPRAFSRIPDREAGAMRRLKAIIDRRNARIEDPNSKDAELNIHAASAARVTGIVSYYIQGDPRGASLYILRPGDVPEGQKADSYYSRGICIW